MLFIPSPLAGEGGVLTQAACGVGAFQDIVAIVAWPERSESK
jgi:hypothetical protein